MESARESSPGILVTPTRHWKRFLPWREPTRQSVAASWWGWFPNIPRNTVGRVCWVLFITAIAVIFLALTVALLASPWNRSTHETSTGAQIFAIVAFSAATLLGCLIFTWHLIDGIALARRETREMRRSQAQLREAQVRVRAARARMLGRS